MVDPRKVVEQLRGWERSALIPPAAAASISAAADMIEQLASKPEPEPKVDAAPAASTARGRKRR